MNKKKSYSSREIRPKTDHLCILGKKSAGSAQIDDLESWSLAYRLKLSDALFGANRLRELDYGHPSSGTPTTANPNYRYEPNRTVEPVNWKTVRPSPIASLSADSLENDFFVHPVDVSSTGNILAICGSDLHFKNMTQGESATLHRFKNPTTNADGKGSCVKWTADERQLISFSKAFEGCSESSMILHDLEAGKNAIDVSLPFYVTSIASTGCESEMLLGLDDGCVVAYDKRQRLSAAFKKFCLDQNIEVPLVGYWNECEQVCSLAVQKGGGQIVAAGCADEVVRVFDRRVVGNGQKSNMYILQSHASAVKALDWHPSKLDVLITGGGSQDRTLKIWDLADAPESGGRGITRTLCEPRRSLDVGEQVSWVRWMSDCSFLTAFRRWHDLPDAINPCVAFFRGSPQGKFGLEGELNGGVFANSIIGVSYSNQTDTMVTAHPEAYMGGGLVVGGGLNVWDCHKLVGFLKSQKKRRTNLQPTGPIQSRFSYYANFK